jgi:hypothetical protein
MMTAARALPAEHGHGRRDEPGQRRRHRPDPQRRQLAADQLAQLHIREREPLRDHRRMLQQRPSGLGQDQPFATAIEQPRAHLGFERRDLLRDSRLRQRQRRRGARERSLTRDGREGHHTTRVENPGILRGSSSAPGPVRRSSSVEAAPLVSRDDAFRSYGVTLAW